MATIEKCDTCSAESPDRKTGLWEGNNWHEITYQDRSIWNAYFRTEKKWLLCGKCFSKLKSFLEE